MFTLCWKVAYDVTSFCNVYKYFAAFFVVATFISILKPKWLYLQGSLKNNLILSISICFSKDINTLLSIMPVTCRWRKMLLPISFWFKFDCCSTMHNVLWSHYTKDLYSRIYYNLYSRIYYINPWLYIFY